MKKTQINFSNRCIYGIFWFSQLIKKITCFTIFKRLMPIYFLKKFVNTSTEKTNLFYFEKKCFLIKISDQIFIIFFSKLSIINISYIVILIFPFSKLYSLYMSSYLSFRKNIPLTTHTVYFPFFFFFLIYFSKHICIILST